MEGFSPQPQGADEVKAMSFNETVALLSPENSKAYNDIKSSGREAVYTSEIAREAEVMGGQAFFVPNLNIGDDQTYDLICNLGEMILVPRAEATKIVETLGLVEPYQFYTNVLKLAVPSTENGKLIETLTRGARDTFNPPTL